MEMTDLFNERQETSEKESIDKERSMKRPKVRWKDTVKKENRIVVNKLGSLKQERTLLYHFRLVN
jgi:hypothetical protein